ncbi:MAG TPA: DUF3999 domain-containing protein [Stenotrophomonas sp.]|jgi:hypothetical protein
MKQRFGWPAVWSALLSFSAVTAAAAATPANSRDDYVREWPLQLSRADAGAYRLTLPEAVYRSAHLASLVDVQPFNAAGQPLPAAVLAPDQPLAARSVLRALPLFALPPAIDAGADDLQVIAERDARGAVMRVETRSRPGMATGSQSPAPTRWLLDASEIDAPLRGLQLQWHDPPTQVQAELRLEGSDDLRHWYLVEPHATVVDLRRDGQRLQQRRIAVDSRARYLRLSVLEGGVPADLSVHAELAAPAQQDWRWLTLDGQPAERGFAFRSPGPFPVARVDVEVEGNQAVEWIVQSRDAEDAPWVQRAGPWLAYRLAASGDTDRSPPQSLAVATRDRYWRLIPAEGVANAMPRLRLGYRPEVLVFLAQGAPPYTLAAGSARARRADAPLPRLVEVLRSQRGPSWQPAEASVNGAPRTLAGDAALKPAPVPLDWKNLLLWAVLIGGAALVAVFALSLMRGRAP